MSKQDIETSVKNYEHERPLYEAFSNKIKHTVEEILISQKINFHTIQARAKTIESYRGKLIKKGTKFDPKDITDLVGVRIIGYTYSDCEKISQAVEKHFELLPEKIFDKSDILGTNMVGYNI